MRGTSCGDYESCRTCPESFICDLLNKKEMEEQKKEWQEL